MKQARKNVDKHGKIGYNLKRKTLTNTVGG